MQAKLTVVGGRATRQDIVLTLPAVIGRSPDLALCVRHPTVSREHCELFERDGQLVVRDKGSSNGTYIGGRRVTEAALKPGDRLTIGPLVFEAQLAIANGAQVAHPAVMSRAKPDVEICTADVASPAPATAPGATASSLDVATGGLPVEALQPASAPPDDIAVENEAASPDSVDDDGLHDGSVDDESVHDDSNFDLEPSPVLPEFDADSRELWTVEDELPPLDLDAASLDELEGPADLAAESLDEAAPLSIRDTVPSVRDTVPMGPRPEIQAIDNPPPPVLPADHVDELSDELPLPEDELADLELEPLDEPLGEPPATPPSAAAFEASSTDEMEPGDSLDLLPEPQTLPEPERLAEPAASGAKDLALLDDLAPLDELEPPADLDLLTDFAKPIEDDLLAGLELEEISAEEPGQEGIRPDSVDEAEHQESAAAELLPTEGDPLSRFNVALSETISEPASLTLTTGPDDDSELGVLEALGLAGPPPRAKVESRTADVQKLTSAVAEDSQLSDRPPVNDLMFEPLADLPPLETAESFGADFVTKPNLLVPDEPLPAPRTQTGQAASQASAAGKTSKQRWSWWPFGHKQKQPAKVGTKARPAKPPKAKTKQATQAKPVAAPPPAPIEESVLDDALDPARPPAGELSEPRQTTSAKRKPVQELDDAQLDEFFKDF